MCELYFLEEPAALLYMAAATLDTVRKGSGESFLDFTRRAVYRALAAGENTLDVWIRQVNDCSSSKEKGDLFETLCAKYLVHPSGGKFDRAWLLGDLPEDIRAELSLPRQDYGIDLIARDHRGKYHAVQAKFRGRQAAGKKTRYSNGQITVPWAELSTFYSLALRGPYDTHWVMTTADGVSRRGGRQATDRSVCYLRLRALPQSFWEDVAQMSGEKLGGGGVPDSSELRARRLAKFGAPDEGAAETGTAPIPDTDELWDELGL